jgi:type I restriction enzyme R subunit
MLLMRHKFEAAAKNLLARLKEEKPNVLIQYWYRNTQSQLKLKDAIETIFNFQKVTIL